MITARDIAGQLGVSISTIGRALADDPRISSKTKELVYKAAQQAGYVGNVPAQIMRGGTSNLIGLIIPDIRNDFYAAIAQALSQTCGNEHYRLVLAITGDDPEIEARNVRELVGARATGVIIVPGATPRKDTMRLLKAIPHVQLLRQVDAIESAWFGIDDERALQSATAHLIAQGHRRIAYFGGEETLSTGAARLRGFRQAIANAGKDLATGIEMLGSPTRDYGEIDLAGLLQGTAPPTAVISGSVHVTIGLIDTIERLKIKVPGDISLIGFGDPEWFAWWQGGLTTVRPPIRELATRCGQWLLAELAGRNPASDAEHHIEVTDCTLVMRKTVKRLRK